MDWMRRGKIYRVCEKAFNKLSSWRYEHFFLMARTVWVTLALTWNKQKNWEVDPLIKISKHCSEHGRFFCSFWKITTSTYISILVEGYKTHVDLSCGLEIHKLIYQYLKLWKILYKLFNSIFSNKLWSNTTFLYNLSKS